MATAADTEYAVLIKASDTSKAVIGAAIANEIQLQKSFRDTKATADGSAASNKALGDTYIKVRAAQLQTAAAMRTLNEQTSVGTALAKALATQGANIAQVFSANLPVLGRMATQISDVTQTSTGAAAAFGAVAVGAVAAAGGFLVLSHAVDQSSKALADHVEKMEVYRSQTGLSAAHTERLDAVLKDMHLTVDSIIPSFRFLNSAIVDAIAKNGDARKAFHAVGVELQDLKTKSTGAIFDQVVSGLGDIESQAVKSNTAVQLLGRGALAVLPLTGAAFEEAGKRAEQVGLVLSGAERAVGAAVDASRDQVDRAREGMQLQAGVLAGILVAPFVKMEAQAANSAAGVLKNFSTIAAAATSAGATITRDLGGSLLKLIPIIANVSEGLLDSLILAVTLGKVHLEKGDIRDVVLDSLGLPKVWVSVKKGTAPDEEEGKGPGEGNGAGAGIAGPTQDAIEKQISAIRGKVAIGAISLTQELDQLKALRAQAETLGDVLAIKREIAGLSGPGGGLIQEARSDAQRAINSFVPTPKNLTILPPPASTFGPRAEPNLTLKPEHAPDIQGALDASTTAGEAFRGAIQSLVAPFASATAAVKTATMAVGSTFVQGMGRAVSSVVMGTQSIGHAFHELINSMVASLAQQGGSFLAGLAITAVGSLFGPAGAVAGAAVSGAMHEQQGGTHLQAGGTVGVAAAFSRATGWISAPVLRAQQGVVTAGVRGLDSIHALIGKGETVLSHAMTDRWDRTLSELSRLITTGARTSAPAAAGAGGGTYHITIPVQVTGVLIDRMALRDLTIEHIAPTLLEVLPKGLIRAS